MNSLLARFLYWQSVGWDQSEMPLAAYKQKEREQKLKQRIGSKAFKHFQNTKSKDPVALSLVAVPFLLVGTVGLFIFMIIP